MFMAFLGSISILAFVTAICLSLIICNKKVSLKKQFKALGNWTFILSIVFCGLLFIVFRFYFDEANKIILIVALEIMYNIIFSLTLRMYARFRLPKGNSITSKKQTRKKLLIVTSITLFFIVAIITIPVTILEGNRKIDNLNLDFVYDSEVVGKWTIVDFVSSPQKFNPDKQRGNAGSPIKDMTFLEDGQLKETFASKKNSQNKDALTPWLSWTKGYVINKGGDHTLSKYSISEINGSKYMFFEWKNGDYLYFNPQPQYYVLKEDVKK